MKRMNANDAQVLQPLTVRLWPGVVREARERGEHVRGGASAVIRAWIATGMRNGNLFARSMYDAPIHKTKTRSKTNDK